MRARSNNNIGVHVAPRVVEAIQVAAATALLTSGVMLVATGIVPDLVLTGAAAQLAHPVSLAALLLLTASTIVLERELIIHGLIAEPAVEATEAAGVMLVANAVEDPSEGMVIEIPDAVIDVHQPTVEHVLTVAAPPALIVLPELEFMAADEPMLRFVGVADPPEPVAMPIDDGPWWTPWMDRGRTSVFEEATPATGPEPDVIDLVDDSRSDHLVGAA